MARHVTISRTSYLENFSFERSIGDPAKTNLQKTIKTKEAGWLAFNITLAQTDHIVPKEYEIYRVGPGSRQTQ